MALEKQSLSLLYEALERLDTGFNTLPAFDATIDMQRLRIVLLETAERLQDNFPYQHPFYIGQMLKPPHPIAHLAYTLTQYINPNNHALDGGRASSQMEKEAVAEIASMFGWQTHLGHLCGGGTMANLEALWVSGRLQPGKKILASEQAHYTHKRISEVLGLSFQSVPCDSYARMDMDALETLLKTGEVGTVIATMGTTAVGSVDPLPHILGLQKKYDFRVHADAAYGGYFTLVNNLDQEVTQAYQRISEVDSIAIDPHKHGLQPYGCGCILFKDPSVGVLYKHESPYTYFSSAELHLGEISLECSRAGAAAVALWATQRMFPLVYDGEFAENLAKCRNAAAQFYDHLAADSRFMVAFPPQLDIVIWVCRAKSASEVSKLSRQLFEIAGKANLHMAVVNLSRSLMESWWPALQWDQDTVTCLRSCLMKPEHLDWLDQIWGVLDQVTNQVLT